MSDVESRLAALEAEVRRLRDHDEILRLVVSYGPLADGATSAERRQKALELFTDDGYYYIDGVGGLRGSEISRLFELDDHHAIMDGGGAHIMSTPHIVVDGDRATALNYTQVHKRELGEVLMETAGASSWVTLRVSINFWQFVRTLDGWKLARRENRLMTGSDEARALLAEVDRG